MPFDFDRNNSALAAIDEAKSQPFIAAGGDVRRYGSVNGVNRGRVLGIAAGRDRAPVGPEPPVLDQDDLVAVDGDGFTLLDDDRPRHRGGPGAVAR